MAVDPSVRIDIAAEFTGKKAFKQADTSTAQLSKNVKNLAKTFGVAFSATKVLEYAKASVKAAAADQKAQQQLALALKNVGLGRDAATAEGYIQRIEKEFGIVDDKLRPAYSRLAIATRDTAETQRLMGIAMDISASTGKDLDSVTSALSKAYLGSNTALSKLGVGISKADLATKSFNDITKQLAATFAGAAVKSADSVSGSMDKLAIATNNAKETIGVGLIEAFANIAGNGEVDQAVSKIDSVAASLSKMIVVASKLKWYDWVIGGITGGTVTDITKFKGMGNVPLTGGSNMDTQRADAAAAKTIAANKAINAKKILADKTAAANKAKLDKAAAVFEIQKIQIAAALKGKITEEEKTRLLLMQAIADEDAAKAEELQKKLEDIQKKNAKIAADLLAIGDAKDPFATWAGSLSLALAALGKLGKGIADVPGLIPGVNFNPTQNADRNYDQKVAAVTGNGDTAGSGGDVVIESIFANDDTIDDILTKVENAAADAAAAAESAAASVAETQDVVDFLAQAVTNNEPVAGVNFNPGQSRDRNFDYMLPTSSTGSMGNVDNSITVVVEGNVLNSDDFDEAVSVAMRNAQRTGYSQYAAGSLP